MGVKERAKAFNDKLGHGGLNRAVTSYTFNSRCLMVYSLYELEDYSKCVNMLSRTISGLLNDLISNRLENKELVGLGVDLLIEVHRNIPLEYYKELDTVDIETSMESIRLYLKDKK